MASVRTCKSLDIGLCIGTATAQLLQYHLLLGDRGRPPGGLGDAVIGMRARGNHAEEQIRPVVLERTAEHLLIDGNRRGPLDVSESMDRSPDAQITNALNVDVGRLVLAAIVVLAILDRHLRETDTDGPDITAKNVTSVEGLTSPNRIVQTFEVDCAKSVNINTQHTSNEKHVLKPQFLCVRTRADSIGP